MTQKQPDWPAIVALALDTDRALGAYSKLGQRVRALYADSTRPVTVVGRLEQVNTSTTNGRGFFRLIYLWPPASD